jgi:cell division initiation protein
MKLTPLDIRHKDFKRGMRGYVDTEVDEFLDEIADEFERLFKENIEMSERCEALQEKIDHYRTLEETLQKTLVSAQRSAEELKVNAQKEAQLILHEAELKARQMVNESYADKQSIEKQIVVMKSSEEDFRFKFRSLLEGYLKQLSGIDQRADKDGGFGRQADEIKKQMEADRAAAPVRRPSPPEATAPAPEPVPAPPLQVVEPPVAEPEPRAPEAAAETAPAPSPTTLGEPDDLLADVESEVDDNEFKW